MSLTQRKKGKKDGAAERARTESHGLIPSCNVDEGDGGGEQAPAKKFFEILTVERKELFFLRSHHYIIDHIVINMIHFIKKDAMEKNRNEGFL